MARNPSQISSKQARAAAAVQLARLGDLEAAKAAFEEAIAFDRRNPDLLFNLAIVEEQRGETDEAAALLSGVLSQWPSHLQAAARLSRLLARFQISDTTALAPNGLKAALLAPGIVHQPIVDVTLNWLFNQVPELADARDLIENGVNSEHDQSIRLVQTRTAEGVSHELLHLVLHRGIVKASSIERTLTGIRAAILLDCAAARFEDRRLTELAIALLVQGWNNDHAWAETPQETAALGALAVDRQKLIGGDFEASRRFLLHALYRPLTEIVAPPLTPAEARRLKPRTLRDTIVPHLDARERQRAFALEIPTLKPVADATSRKVASQYEAAPYPRWQSLHRSQAGMLKSALSRHFNPDRLAFMDGSFDVLIAGCGTGQQALQTSTAYGPQARLIGLDLSIASLGYAADMAAAHAIDNVTFIQGDILDCGLLDREFDIIECVGVLHHMADWRAGWQTLLQRLKPSGLMYIGLYSAVSRANLSALRTEPGYPGPGCSNDAARKYRRELLLRLDAAAGSELKLSRDFYALNAFRDLVLHESETHVTLEEIAEFLDANSLVFRGFTIEPQIAADFAASFPAHPLPGTLSDWAAFERDHPRTFDGMYRFWVEPRN